MRIVVLFNILSIENHKLIIITCTLTSDFSHLPYIVAASKIQGVNICEASNVVFEPSKTEM